MAKKKKGCPLERLISCKNRPKYWINNLGKHTNLISDDDNNCNDDDNGTDDDDDDDDDNDYDDDYDDNDDVEGSLEFGILFFVTFMLCCG